MLLETGQVEGIGEGLADARIAGIDPFLIERDIDAAALARFQGLHQLDQLGKERRLPQLEVGAFGWRLEFLAVFGDRDIDRDLIAHLRLARLGGIDPGALLLAQALEDLIDIGIGDRCVLRPRPER